MQLSREAIEEFKAMYRDAYGVHLSDAEAQEMGQRVLMLFHLFSRPLPLPPHHPGHTPPPPR